MFICCALCFKLVESILINKPCGEPTINEYNRTKSLMDETRRKMVNILAADMTEKNGTSPPRQLKAKYVRGIVTLFPYLSDPFSKNGYEQYGLSKGEFYRYLQIRHFIIKDTTLTTDPFTSHIEKALSLSVSKKRISLFYKALGSSFTLTSQGTKEAWESVCV
ncbi:hypothetical protein N1851_026655 [Merluccius polli]|uniref:Uncharacterized protein n=1 Tax=Merluccius polli TaxID=89951 RepID=A0AA47NU22_MERPO|nr:hypothetical protein N1851_026655 [Merluccius polli]